MKSFLTLLSFLLLTSNSFSQNGWVQVNSGTTKNLNKAFFINSNTGWVCGDSGIVIKTTNKGFTWTTCTTNTLQPLRDIFFLDENLGWAVGGRPAFSDPRMLILHTFNGGASWITLMDMLDFDNCLASVHFYDAGTGIVSGFGGNGSATTGIFRLTSNGGNNWTYSTTYSTYDMKIDNSGNIWRLCGLFVDVGVDSSWIQLSNNRGASWNSKWHSSKISLRDLDLINNSTAYVLADSGSQKFILKTFNAGNIWERTVYSLPSYPNTFDFINTNTGWTGRTSIYCTTNAGLNWIQQKDVSPYSISRIKMLDSLQGICLLSNGKIYITGTGGVMNVHQNPSQFPNKFFLSQNYPNPFNPLTRINYELPITNYVSIKIYDALGNEVKTLVNEKQNAGSYSVDFNAASLPSGIYFYKLVTENFSETRKMILIK
jgi:photosystem II stability/assembly factor-like uncharacterized protein